MEYTYLFDDFQSSSNEDINEEFLDDCFDNEYFSITNNNNEKSNNQYNYNNTNLIKDSDANTPMHNQLSNTHSSISTKSLNNISTNNKNEALRYDHNKKPKRKLKLSKRAQDLKKDYFLIFTKKKKFPKTIIKKIHKIMEIYLNLKPMSRDTVRFNDLYFEEYAKDSDLIIQFLVLNKGLILALIPELHEHII